MDNIVEAERRTSCGVFLFTKDDDEIRNGFGLAVPRDNVVFEAGFFAGRKEPGSILIIHERGAQIPSDLGGFVYLELKKRNGISTIETQIADYFASRFS
jgi:predicted nucleotide-binding protein